MIRGFGMTMHPQIRREKATSTIGVKAAAAARDRTQTGRKSGIFRRRDAVKWRGLGETDDRLFARIYSMTLNEWQALEQLYAAEKPSDYPIDLSEALEFLRQRLRQEDIE